MTGPTLGLLAIPGLPAIQPGDDLAGLILAATKAAGLPLVDDDVVVVAQKVVSKAEGRFVALTSVSPSPEAMDLAARTGKDPRLVEVILSETRRVVRSAPNVLITEHRLGLVMANAGVDQSNVGPADEGERVLLLPANPDGSAERLRAAVVAATGAEVAVVINDSFGRPWRRGTAGVAIGAAGLASVVDRRGESDLFGRTLQATVIGHADEIAAAASLLMGQADEGLPVVIVRGLRPRRPHGPARDLVRPAGEDLFR